MKKIFLLGATGGTGSCVVELALARGFAVAALVRDPDRNKVRHPHLTVHQGDALNEADVRAAMSGADAVLCTLGPPPSRAAQVDLCERVTGHVVAGMQAHGIRRVVCQTAYGTGNSRTFSLSARLSRLVMPGIMADKDRQEAILERSPLDWTIVRPPTLTKGERTGTYRVSEVASFWLWSSVSRADVADFMLAQLTDTTFVRRAVCIRGG